MSSFEDTLKQISDLEQQIYDLKNAQHGILNEVTSRYMIAMKNREPANPTFGGSIIDGDEWSVDSIGGYVHVNVWCRGECETYGIPIEYFTDESTLKAFEEECEKVKEEREANEAKRKEERERKEFERLKKKFESGE